MSRLVRCFLAVLLVHGFAWTSVGRADFIYVSDPGTGGANQGVIDTIDSSGHVATYASGLSNPHGLAFDASGNLYVANTGTNQIVVIPPGGGSFSVFANFIGNPQGLAFDASGNLYVANGSAYNQITKITPTGQATTFVSGVMGVTGLAFDPSGNLYASSTAAGGTIYKYNSSGTQVGSTTPTFSPLGLAYGNNGIYVGGGNSLNQLQNDNSITTISGTNSLNPYGVAVDSSGNVLVVALVDYPSNVQEVVELPSGSTPFTVLGSGLSQPTYIALPAGASVPEPSTLALVGVLGLGAGWWLRRRHAGGQPCAQPHLPGTGSEPDLEDAGCR